MKPIPQAVRERRRIAVDAAMLFVIVLLITQMWLLTATLESYLAGHHEVALPGVLTSGVLFLLCLGLFRLVVWLDKSPERDAETEGIGPWHID